MTTDRRTPARALARGSAVAFMMVAVVPLAADTGCESCDFSFEPIPVHVALTPREIHAKITLCTELDDACEARSIDGTLAPGGITDEDLEFTVDWQGYAACRVPEMRVRVDAEGCASHTVLLERHRPADNDMPGVEIPVVLDCK